MKHEFFLRTDQLDFFENALMKIWESGWTGGRPKVTETVKDNGSIILLECNTQDFAAIMVKTGYLMGQQADIPESILEEGERALDSHNTIKP